MGKATSRELFVWPAHFCGADRSVGFLQPFCSWAWRVSDLCCRCKHRPFKFAHRVAPLYVAGAFCAQALAALYHFVDPPDHRPGAGRPGGTRRDVRSDARPHLGSRSSRLACTLGSRASARSRKSIPRLPAGRVENLGNRVGASSERDSRHPAFLSCADWPAGYLAQSMGRWSGICSHLRDSEGAGQRPSGSDTATWLIVYGIAAFALVRFGLITLAVAVFVANIMLNVPVTLDFALVRDGCHQSSARHSGAWHLGFLYCARWAEAHQRRDAGLKFSSI